MRESCSCSTRGTSAPKREPDPSAIILSITLTARYSEFSSTSTISQLRHLGLFGVTNTIPMSIVSVGHAISAPVQSNRLNLFQRDPITSAVNRQRFHTLPKKVRRLPPLFTTTSWFDVASERFCPPAPSITTVPPALTTSGEVDSGLPGPPLDVPDSVFRTVLFVPTELIYGASPPTLSRYVNALLLPTALICRTLSRVIRLFDPERNRRPRQRQPKSIRRCLKTRFRFVVSMNQMEKR